MPSLVWETFLISGENAGSSSGDFGWGQLLDKRDEETIHSHMAGEAIGQAINSHVKGNNQTLGLCAVDTKSHSKSNFSRMNVFFYELTIHKTFVRSLHSM